MLLHLLILLNIKTMINIDLVNVTVDIKNYSIATQDEYPMLFLGFVIKNQYDDERIQLSEKYNPVKFIHFSKDRSTFTALKGIKLLQNDIINSLSKQIELQEKQVMNLAIYKNLLSQFGFDCKETYSFFSPGTYPVDFNNLKSVCTDEFNTDKKIFQHLLNLDENIFEFQKFSSLKLFILTV